MSSLEGLTRSGGARRQFHQLPQPRMEVFLTSDRGFGVRAAEPIARGSFVVEYTGALHAGAAFGCNW